MRKSTLIKILCVCAFAANESNAQNAADVLKNIEQNTPPVTQVKPATKRPMVAASTDQGFARLKEIRVDSPLFQQELQAYWISELNQPVPAQKIADFKAFAWDLFQTQGYLAYITTSEQQTAEGTILTINVTLPIVGKVTVLSANDHKGEEYAETIAQRFSETFNSGTRVDIQGFEKKLNEISYDLPVDLDISMQQVNEKTVDLVINLHYLESDVGKVLGGLIQANNYGLSQYGRNQVLGQVKISGLTPLSELTAITQQSQGVAYFRVDYEAPLVGSGMRWKTYGSQVSSLATNVKGNSNEIGAALTRLISSTRSTRWLASFEASQRETVNWASGSQLSDRVDEQVRLKLRTESVNSSTNSYFNEIMLTAGSMNLDRNASDLSTDQTTTYIAGQYRKFEVNGNFSHDFDIDRAYTGSVRWRAQIANKNMDTYNQIAIGGINGLRSLTTIDGAGDQGAVLSFDFINHRQANLYGGLFYDLGVVKSRRNAIPNNGSNDSYTLQDVGYQLGGLIEKINWSLSVGKSFDKTPNVWTAANTPIGTLRVNFAASYAF